MLNDRGISCYLNGEYEKSVESLTSALRIDPTNTRTYNNLGLAFVGLGKYEEAFEAFKKGKDEASAHNNIGYVYMIEQKYAEATDALQKAEEASPNFYVKAHENIERLQRLTRKAGPQPAEQAIRTE